MTKHQVNKMIYEINDLNYTREQKALFMDMFNEYQDNLRQCSYCNALMNEGYCIEGGMDYYCSDECLEEEMTMEEFNTLFDNGNGDTYWTEWI